MSKPTLAVYAVRPASERGQKDFFTRIGTAFPHPNGEGMNILLDALPIFPKLVCLSPKKDKDTEESPLPAEGV